ncbi:MAG: ammonium transporter [Bryobacteraceae bacterium]
MTPVAAAALPEAQAAVCLLFILLIPFAGAGLALIHSGLGRSRNAAHALLSALCAISVAALVYCAFGLAWQGYAGRPAIAIAINGKAWDWIGAEKFFFNGLAFNGDTASLAALLGMFGAGLAAIIPLSSGADRWRLSAVCASSALLAGCTYPLFAHWVWGGGWLAQLGRNYGLGRGFIDSGGASSIQVVGGLTALALTWILGPRRGKYAHDGMPIAIPGHNAVLVLLGCFLAWIGWLGLDCAGAILFTGVAVGRTALVAVNTTLGAASAALAGAAIARARFGKTDASLTANAWIGGLVAASAGCAVMRPGAAIMVGMMAGALVIFAVDWLELHLKIDDPGGAVPVHALCGLWGLIATGMFTRPFDGFSEQGQWAAQLVGAATLIGFVLPLTYGLNWALDRIRRQRIAPEGERQGLDLFELGAGAYPDLLSHDDGGQR